MIVFVSVSANLFIDLLYQLQLPPVEEITLPLTNLRSQLQALGVADTSEELVPKVEERLAWAEAVGDDEMRVKMEQAHEDLQRLSKQGQLRTINRILKKAFGVVFDDDE